jgi:hypothetical protein
MLRKSLLTCVIFFCAAVLARAADAVVEFEGRYWMPDLAAKAKVTESSIAGSDVNFKSELGIKDEDFPEGRFIWHTGPNSRIRAYYTQAQFKGDRIVARTINFDGKTYTAGARVRSKLDLQYFGLGWLWEFIDVLDGKLKMGTVLEAKGVAGKVTLDAPSLAINESADFIAGLPTAGVTVTISPFKDEKPYASGNVLSNFSIYAEGAGMSAGKYGYFIDAEAGLRWTPVTYVSVSGGYRNVSLKAQDKPDYAKLELRGPFAAASIRF